MRGFRYGRGIPVFRVLSNCLASICPSRYRLITSLACWGMSPEEPHVIPRSFDSDGEWLVGCNGVAQSSCIISRRESKLSVAVAIASGLSKTPATRFEAWCHHVIIISRTLDSNCNSVC